MTKVITGNTPFFTTNPPLAVVNLDIPAFQPTVKIDFARPEPFGYFGFGHV
jgi:hypothetical protein